MDLKVTYFPPVNVVFIPGKIFNSFVSRVPETLRKSKSTEQLPNIPSMMQFFINWKLQPPFKKCSRMSLQLKMHLKVT